ncbi:MAG: hypothetical protein V9E96_05860 [Chitinophagaceae bacterium]
MVTLVPHSIDDEFGFKVNTGAGGVSTILICLSLMVLLPPFGAGIAVISSVP